jgi:hypothetical protein
MPRATGGIFLCLIVSGMGCERFFTPSDKPVTPSVARSLAPAFPADSLIVESVLIERPLGDPYIDRELWESTMPVGSPETRALLAENGLRASILVGIFPSQLQTMLGTKADVVDPHLLTFNNRKEAVLPSAGPIKECQYDLLADLAGKPESFTLKDANCGVLVRPQPLEIGKVKLWCEPQLQHGSRLERFRASEDGTRLTVTEEMPTEKYPVLGFEVVLHADECLAIGSISERQNTLGTTLFGVEVEGTPRQRLLLIRSRQVNVSATANLPAITVPGRRPASTEPASLK